MARSRSRSDKAPYRLMNSASPAATSSTPANTRNVSTPMPTSRLSRTLSAAGDAACMAVAALICRGNCAAAIGDAYWMSSAVSSRPACEDAAAAGAVADAAVPPGPAAFAAGPVRAPCAATSLPGAVSLRVGLSWSWPWACRCGLRRGSAAVPGAAAAAGGTPPALAEGATPGFAGTGCTSHTVSTLTSTSRSITPPVGARMPTTSYGCSSCAVPPSTSPCDPTIVSPIFSGAPPGPPLRAASAPTTACISSAHSRPVARVAP